MEMKKRSIAGCIILTFVTFGIYGIYWFVKLTNETNRLAPEEATMSGGLAFLVTLCTLGIYGLYWGYKLGKKMDIISGKESNSGIIYLLLTLLGLGIIAEALAQNQDRETGERLRSCGMILNNTRKYVPRSAQRADRGVSI